MHTGAQYHEFMLASPRDRAVRERFQQMALDLHEPTDIGTIALVSPPADVLTQGESF